MAWFLVVRTHPVAVDPPAQEDAVKFLRARLAAKRRPKLQEIASPRQAFHSLKDELNSDRRRWQNARPGHEDPGVSGSLPALRNP
jgi:hypothetical protein